MRKNDRFEQGSTATGAARRAKVFGIKSMTVVMTAAMLLSGVPTSAIAEELQEAGVIAAQDSTEQAESAGQQATEQSGTQEQSQATPQQSAQSSSQGNAAATQDSSQPAQPVQQATTADIALTLNNASITYKGQVIAQPAQKVTASTGDNFQFTVQPDNGYKLNRVKLTLNGSERELKADANGLYTVSAADVAQSPRITLETEQEKNGETAEEATPIEDTANAAATQSAEDGVGTISGPTSVAQGDTITLTYSGDMTVDNWYGGDGLFSGWNVSSDKKSITLTATNSWAFNGSSKNATLYLGYIDRNGTWHTGTDGIPFEVTVRKRTFTIVQPEVKSAGEDCFWLPQIKDNETGEIIDLSDAPSGSFYPFEYYRDGQLIPNATQYWHDSNEFKKSGTYKVVIKPNSGWIYDFGGQSEIEIIIPTTGDKDKKTITADKPSDHIYDGKAHKWTPKVTDESGSEVPESGYTVIYKRDGKETTDFTSTGTITVTITGKDKYSGTIERSYCIYGIKGKDQIKVGDKTTYTGSGFTSDVTWSSSDSGILTIDPNTGEATGVYPGAVTIYAVDKDGHSCSKEVTVVEDSSKGAWVYLYTKVVYNGVDLSASAAGKKKAAELGLTVNKDGWFTLGKVWVSGIEAASGSNTGKSNGTDGSKKIAGFREKTIALLPRTIRYQTANGSINLSDVAWGYMTNVSSGATNYVTSGYTWHFDGQIDIKSMSKVTVHYVELGNKSNKLADSVEVAAQTGSTFVPKNEAISIKGYNLAQADPAITVDETGKQEVYLYYSKGNYPYTVKYVDKETNKDLADPSTVRGEYGANVTVNALKFQGYSVDAEEKSLTIGDGDNTIIFYYTKKSVAYTIKYMWDGNEIAEGSTGSLKFGESVIAEEKTIDGYTIIPNQTLTKTAGDNDFTITVKYYKNVTLTAKSDTKTYNGREQTLEGYTSSDEAAKFDDVTAKGSGTDAGEYEVAFNKDYTGTVSKDGTYIVSGTTPGKLTISPVTKELVITVTGHTGGEKYNGKEQTVEGYDVAGLPDGMSKDDVLYDGAAEAKGTDAGTYKMNLDKAKFSVKESAAKNYTNVRFKVTDGELSIAKRKITLWSEDGHKNYDGAALQRRTDINVDGTKNVWNNETGSWSEKTFAGDGFVSGEGIEGKTKTVWTNQNDASDETNIAPGVYNNKFRVTFKDGTNPGNYEITEVYGKLYVNKRVDKDRYTVTINAVSKADATYNGKKQSVSGVFATVSNNKYSANGMTFVNDKNVAFTITGFSAQAEGTDADTYTSKVVKDEDKLRVVDQYGNDVTDQFTFKTNDGSLVINKRAVTIKPKDASREYNGKALTPSDFEVVEGSFVDGQGIESCTYGGSQTQVGTSNSSIKSMKAKSGTDLEKNYEVKRNPGALTVIDRNAKYQITVEANSGEFTYDGTEHEVTGLKTDKFVEDGIEYTVSGLTADLKKADAGTYSVEVTGTAKVTDPDGNDVTAQFAVDAVPGELKINKRNVTLKAASDEKVYDGKALTNSNVTVGGDGFADGEGATYEVVGSQVDAGESANTITSYTLNNGTKESNYEIKTYPGVLKVTPVADEIVVTVEGATKTVLYNGEKQAASGVVITSSNEKLVPGKNLTYTGPMTANGTDAGTYENQFYKTDFEWNTGNFTNVRLVFKNKSIKLVVQPKDLKVTTPSKTKVYDGTALMADGKIEGLVNGETVDFKTTGSQTEQGTSDNTYDLKWNGSAKEKNYTVKENVGKLTVAKQSIKPGDEGYKGITVSNLKDVKYNGKDQKQEPIVKNGNTGLVKGRDYELSYSEDAVNAGEVTVTVKGIGNYTGEVTRTYNITPRHVKLSSNTHSKTYDGTALTDATVVETGGDSFVAGEVNNIRAMGSITDPGTVENTITFDKGEKFKEGNYVIEYQTGRLTVDSKNVASKGMTVSKPDDTIYNGHEQKFEPVVKDGEKKLTKGVDYDLSYSDDVTNAGTVTVTVTGKGNYAGTTTVTYEIGKRPVALMSNGGTKYYDGVALEDHDVVVTSKYDFVTGEVEDLKANGSITEPGEVTNNITYTKAASYKDSNYDVTITEGKLKVLPRDLNATGMEISNLEDVIYNGLDQKQAPEVKDSKIGKTLAAGIDYDVKYSDDTKNVGEVTVTITGKGNFTGTAARTYKITPAPLTVATDSASQVYNGRELTATGTITGFVNGESVDFKTTGKQKRVGSSANTYSIDWTGAKKTNYSIVSESIGTLTVTESAQTIVVATVGGRYEYDGTTHTPTVNVYNLPDGYTVRDASSNAAVKDANAYKDDDRGIKVTADNLVILNADGEDVTSKLNIEKNGSYLAVTPRTVTVTTPSDSKVYDGTALKAEGTIVGLVDGETAEFKTIGSQTEQGTSDNTYDLKWNGSAKKSNYTVKENVGKLTVTKQSIDKTDEKAYKGITIDDPKSVKYDGGKHQWAPTVTDADGNVLTAGTDYKVSYKRGDNATDDFKNVGSITVTIEGVGNYTGTVTKTYKITKRNVMLTSADASWTYDGKDHQKTDVAASGDGFVEGEGVNYSNFATVKDVTSKDVENTFDYAAKKGTDLGNYEITVKTGKLSVTRAAAEGNITLTTKDANKTYDGHALATGDATAKSATGDGVKIEYSLDYEHWTENRSDVTLTDAGNKTVYVRASSKKNYSGYVEGAETLTVNPATLTIVTPKAEKTYDGKALTAEGSMKGLVNDETAEFKTTGSLTEVGQTDNAYTLTWNGTAKAGNYTIKATVGKLTVKPRSIDDDTYGMSVSSPKDAAYDGTEHKWAPVVKDGEKTLVEGVDYTVDYNKDDFTNVTGAIKVTITGRGNYTGSIDRTYQIKPAELTVVTEGASKVYDGEALTHDVATIKGLKNGESATIHATGTQTEVGESDNTYEITWDGSAQQGNYTVARETLGKLAVSESADQITVAPRNVTVQYDGDAHGTTVDVNGLPKGYSVKTATSKATVTNVSEGEVTAKVDELVIVNAKGEDVTSKLNIKRGTATIKVTPAPLTVTTDGGKKEYDGTALTAKGVKVDGLKGGDKVSAWTTGSRTKVGKTDNTYSIDWTNAKSSNYAVTAELGTLEVTPSAAAVTLASGSAERTYNGHALTSEKITAKGLPASFTVEATMDGTQTDAGSSENTVEDYKILDAKGDDVTDMFANVTVETGTLTVVPKQITVETEGGTKVYDGAALTNKKGSISGLVAGEHADVVTNGAQTEVGTSDNGYTIAWDSAKAGNYTVASETLGKLTVTPQSVNPADPAYRDLTVSDPEDATYDGDAHKWAPEVKDTDGNALREGVDYTLSHDTDDFVDAGTITVTVHGKGNYTGAVSKTYRIKPASVSIRTDSASRVYNGHALTAGGAITGLVNGETVDFKTTGTRTKVGTSDNTYELNWTGSAKKGNYSVDSEELGKLTVTESTDQIVVTTTGGTYTYDGRAHGAQVAVSQLPEGYTVDGTPASDASATDVNGDGVKATVDHLVIRNADGEDVTSQLNIKKVDGTITITPAPLAVVTDSASKVYDGTALTAGGTVTGLVNGEKATLAMTGTQIESGSSKNTYKLMFDKTAKEKNYTVASENIGTLTVTPQSITPADPSKPDESYKGVTVDEPSDSVYDGVDHKWAPVVKDVDGKTLEEGTDYEVSYDSDDFKNVQTINVTITGKGNYTGTVTKSYRITKAPLHIVTGSASKVFDGTVLTNGAVTVDGLAQTDRIGITVTGRQLGVGSSKNTYIIDWMQVDQNNYELTDQLGTLTVTAAPVTPQNATTPGITPGTTPAAPASPAGTGNNIANTVATALANGYSAATGNSQSAAPNEEQIFDAKNPLGKYDGKKDTCWVHWYMILCGLVTAIYGLFVCLRRRKHSHRLEDNLKKVLDNDDETQE